METWRFFIYRQGKAVNTQRLKNHYERGSGFFNIRQHKSLKAIREDVNRNRQEK